MSGPAGEGLRLRPAAMTAGGDALARDEDGRVVFVEGALPGELVVARVTTARRDYARAVTVEVVEPSPDRVAPPCPALGAGCGGCTWQHVAPAAQLRLKADIVADALRRIARLPEPPAPTVVALPGPALRTTARLGVDGHGRAGHRPRSESGGAVPTDACLTLHPLVEELVVDGRYHGAGEVLLRAGVASGERLARVGAGTVRVVTVEVPDDVEVVQEGERAFVHETVAGRTFRVSVDSFFQPGPAAAEALVAAVRGAVGDALGPGGHLVDAYAGTGLFASVLGRATGARVTAVESGRAAAADARVNLGDLDAKVVVAEVARWEARRNGPADVVVADPARPGLGRPGVTALVAAGAARMVLVSCDPASLARDTLLLGEAGYRLAALALVDAFPHTFHVETVARFDRDDSPAPKRPQRPRRGRTSPTA
ncbi:MAG TPA: TRAM domain-containing protein [Acidimicrobiales bacterium]|nr:TRAM domain-containing protein [Acidimicrobiales bacterium]